MTGQLLGIAVRAKSRGEMTELGSIEISTENGLAGDFRGKPCARQVTVLSIESWKQACKVVEEDLPWTTRRANLLVSGLELKDTAGSILQIGSVQLKVTGETDPCGRMNEYFPCLMQALVPDWRGGVCCRVVTGGQIQIQEEVILRNAGSLV